MPRFFLALFLLLAPFLNVWASAQVPTPTPTPSGPIQMRLDSPLALTRQPLSIVARSGRWFPVAVTLANTGPEVSGEVRLRLVAANGNLDFPANDFYAPVVLPQNSRKVVWLYGRLDRGNVSGVSVSFSGRAFTSLEDRANLTLPDEAQRVIVVVSDGGDGMAEVLKSLRAPKLYRQSVAPQFRANLPPLRTTEAPREMVPDRWVGFDAADAVVLGDFPHASLAPLQIDALRGYAFGGGTLVVPGGANAARLGASPLKELWPLAANGSTTASASQTANLVARYVQNPQNGADRLGGAPVALLTGGAAANSVVVQNLSASSPLLAWRNSGGGRVVMSSFDPSQPPFLGWSGQDNLWSELIGLSARAPRFDALDSNAEFALSSGISPAYNQSYNFEEENQQSFTDRLLASLSRARQLRLPPVSQIAWFLALYVFILVPVNYTVLRLIDKREWAWVTIPVIVVIFSVWAYSEALSIRGRAILTRQIDVVQSSPGAPSGRVDSLFWLFSPRNTRYDLTSSGQNAVIADFWAEDSAAQGAFPILQPEDGSGFKVEGALLNQWASRAFVAQSLADLKGGLTVNGQILQNSTPYDLQGVVYIERTPRAKGNPDSKIRTVGELKKGANFNIGSATTQTVNADLSGALVRAGQLNSFFDASMLSNGVPTQALNFALQNAPSDGAIVVGWANQSVAPIKIDQARDTDVTLFVWRVAKNS